MNRAFFAYIVAFSITAASTPALSADASVTASRPYHFSAEVMPLTLLINLVPGSRGFTGGAEVPLGEHLAAFGTASFVSLHLSDSLIKESTESGDANAIIRDMRTVGGSAGARYYGRTTADSWYAGAQLGAGSNKITWDHGGESVVDKSEVMTTGIQAGYRWLWDSGFLMRVGAELGATNVRNREISAFTASASPTAIDDVEKAGQQRKTQLSTGFDFGVGWSF